MHAQVAEAKARQHKKAVSRLQSAREKAESIAAQVTSPSAVHLAALITANSACVTLSSKPQASSVAPALLQFCSSRLSEFPMAVVINDKKFNFIV